MMSSLLKIMQKSYPKIFLFGGYIQLKSEYNTNQQFVEQSQNQKEIKITPEPFGYHLITPELNNILYNKEV